MLHVPSHHGVEFFWEVWYSSKNGILNTWWFLNCHLPFTLSKNSWIFLGPLSKMAQSRRSLAQLIPTCNVKEPHRPGGVWIPMFTNYIQHAARPSYIYALLLWQGSAAFWNLVSTTRRLTKYLKGYNPIPMHYTDSLSRGGSGEQWKQTGQRPFFLLSPGLVIFTHQPDSLIC